MSLIQIRGLTKLYRMGEHVVRALDGVDLSINAGEFVAITGASGSGKSTMMHLLGCLDRPTAGSYVLRGRDVSNMSDGELADIRNREIGFVFQTFNLINRTTAMDNVAVPLFYARKSDTRTPAMNALARVGLDKRASHKPSELSGGERQRVAIARAIVTNPAFLLADEPTGNLDSKTGDQIMDIFHSLNAQGVTIVLVTHEPDIAAQARRIVQMRDGKIVADRTRDEWQSENSGGAKPFISAPPIAPPSPVFAAPAPSVEPAAARDAVAAPPATTAEASLPAGIHKRRAPGATGAMINGLTAMLCYAGIIATIITLKMMGVPMERIGPEEAKKFGTQLMIGTCIFLVLMAGTIVLGILAIRFGLAALGHIRREKGLLIGRVRAWVGLACGTLAVGFPLISLVIAVGQAVAKLGKTS